MKLVILDRDGVINQDSDDYIKSPEEFIPIPGSLEAIARLNRAGYKVAIATNQSGLARGYFGPDTLILMHEKLRRLLSEIGGHIDVLEYCPHGPDDGCECRKPRPGLLLRILARFDIDPGCVNFIGDNINDLKTARNAGVLPVLVLTGKGRKTLANGAGLEGVPVYEDLAHAVDAILRNE